MFIRREKKKRGSDEVIHVALAHNVREPDVKRGGTRPNPVVLARLGKEEDLDVNRVKSASDAFDRYLRKRFGDVAADEGQLDAAADTLREQAPVLEGLCSKSFGMRVVVEAVWKHLGFDVALCEVEASVASTFPLERIVFAMVLNRLVDPTSKHACNE